MVQRISWQLVRYIKDIWLTSLSKNLRTARSKILYIKWKQTKNNHSYSYVSRLTNWMTRPGEIVLTILFEIVYVQVPRAFLSLSPGDRCRRRKCPVNRNVFLACTVSNTDWGWIKKLARRREIFKVQCWTPAAGRRRPTNPTPAKVVRRYRIERSIARRTLAMVAHRNMN
jgi:hypothetical protein